VQLRPHETPECVSVLTWTRFSANSLNDRICRHDNIGAPDLHNRKCKHYNLRSSSNHHHMERNPKSHFGDKENEIHERDDDQLRRPWNFQMESSTTLTHNYYTMLSSTHRKGSNSHLALLLLWIVPVVHDGYGSFIICSTKLNLYCIVYWPSRTCHRSNKHTINYFTSDSSSLLRIWLCFL
jgi:hypothetical protein